MKRLPLTIFLFLASLYMITASGHMYVRDELTRYEVTRSIVERGELAIEQGYGDTGRDGKLYSKYGLGQSLLAIPLYAASLVLQRGVFPSDPFVAQLGLCFFNSMITGFIGALMFVFLTRLGHGPRPAAAAVLLYATCTLAWPYTQTFFTEPLAGLLLLGAAYALLFGRAPVRAGLTAGALLAGAFITRMDMVAPIVVFGAFMFLRWLKSRDAQQFRAMAAAAAPIAGAVCLQLAYNWWRFGDVTDFGYQGESFTSPMAEGLYGLLFSTGKGLIFFSPAVVIAALGFARLIKRNRAAAFLCAAPLAVSLFLYSKWNLWGGDLSWGPRYLVTFLPLAMMPAAEFMTGLAHGASKAKIALLAFVAAAAIIVNALALAADFHVYTDLLVMTSDRFGDTDRMMRNVYFTPGFSPIAGHAEMVRLMVSEDKQSRLFNPGGDPGVAAAIAAHGTPDFWWAVYLDKFRDSPARRTLILAALVLLSAALSASGLRLWRELQECTPATSPDG